jgi:hypothetical protein
MVFDGRRGRLVVQGGSRPDVAPGSPTTSSPLMLASSDLIEFVGGTVAAITPDLVAGCIVGIPAPSIVVDGMPQVGNREFAITVVAAEPSTIAALGIGYPALPMFAVGNGCYLRVSPAAAEVQVPNGAGVARYDLQIGSNPSLVGTPLWIQGATLASRGVTMTQTLGVMVGF